MEVQRTFKYLKSLSSTTTFYLVLISLLFWKLCKRLIFWTFNLFLLIYNFFFVKNFRIIFSLRFWMLWKKLMHLVLSLSLSLSLDIENETGLECRHYSPSVKMLLVLWWARAIGSKSIHTTWFKRCCSGISMTQGTKLSSTLFGENK